jgi:hypothetical protein
MWISGLVSCLFLSLSFLAGMSLRPIGLEEMVAYSQRIFRGVCTAAEPAGSVAGLPVTLYTFRILERIKGADGERTVSFRQLGGEANSLQIPAYRVDEEYVLFLYPESEMGLTSPVGLLQGAFQVTRATESGQTLVQNGVGNLNLYLKETTVTRGPTDLSLDRRSVQKAKKLTLGRLLGDVGRILGDGTGEEVGP